MAVSRLIMKNSIAKLLDSSVEWNPQLEIESGSRPSVFRLKSEDRHRDERHGVASNRAWSGFGIGTVSFATSASPQYHDSPTGCFMVMRLACFPASNIG